MGRRKKKPGAGDFKPGENGEPRGPDIVPRGYIKALYARFLADPHNIELLYKTIQKMAQEPRTAITLMQDMADRMEGKPKQELEIAVRRSTTFELTAGPPETPTRE